MAHCPLPSIESTESIVERENGKKGKKGEGRKAEDRAGMKKLMQKQESSGAPGLPPFSVIKAMSAYL